MWSELGSPPAHDEAEVTVMGPGYGECVLVHLSDGDWLVVDSCIETDSTCGESVALRYLRALNVGPAEAVRVILASHWDQDHVRGIAGIVEECRSARFYCPDCLTEREFRQLISEVSVTTPVGEENRCSSFIEVMRLMSARAQTIYRATPNRRLWAAPLVVSWSPSDYEKQLFMEFVAANRPKVSRQRRQFVPSSPNLTSTVLSIDWGHTAAWLGGDMEVPADNDDRRGWGAVVAETRVAGFAAGDLLKVPHHGSRSGHDQRMWDDLLRPMPISVIAPYGRGRVESRPPRSSDVARIVRLSGEAYLTARDSKKKNGRTLEVNRTTREQGILLQSQRHSLGIVRSRKRAGGSWRTEVFGAAVKAK